MLYHERERKKEENANFVHIVYLLAKFCNIFDEAIFIGVSIEHVLKPIIMFSEYPCCSERTKMKI